MDYGIYESESAKQLKLFKAEFDIFCTEKHKGSTRDYKGTTNANPVNDIQTEISLRLNEDNDLSKPKDDRT